MVQELSCWISTLALFREYGCERVRRRPGAQATPRRRIPGAPKEKARPASSASGSGHWVGGMAVAILPTSPVGGWGAGLHLW